MAGLGRKIFTAGDILLASEVQGFLQDQSVMVFDDDAARTAAIATPTEGMVTFRKDDNALEVFDGSTFVAVGGGAEPGLVHINTTSISASSSENFNDVFSATFDNYRIILTVTGTDVTQFRLRVAGTDTTTNYNRSGRFFNTSSVVNFFFNGDSQSSFAIGNTLNNFLSTSDFILTNPNKASATQIQGLTTRQSSTNLQVAVFGGNQSAATQFTGFSLVQVSGNITGSISIYGLAKA